MLPKCNSGPNSWQRQRPSQARNRTQPARAGNIAMCRKRWRACAQRRSRPAGWRNRLKWCHSRTSQAKELKTWRKLRNRIPEPAGETIRAPGRMRLPGLIGWPSTRCTPLWSYPRNSSSAYWVWKPRRPERRILGRHLSAPRRLCPVRQPALTANPPRSCHRQSARSAVAQRPRTAAHRRAAAACCCPQ